MAERTGAEHRSGSTGQDGNSSADDHTATAPDAVTAKNTVTPSTGTSPDAASDRTAAVPTTETTGAEGATDSESDSESGEVAEARADSPSNSRLVSAGALMAAGTMISRVLGFVRVAFLAFLIGNGTAQADTYAIATTIPTSLYILFAGGALNTVLVPQLVRAVKNDPDGGEAYTNRIITAFLVIVGAITAIVTIAAPLVIRVYSADEWQVSSMTEHYDAMVFMAYLCLPTVFLYGAFFLFGQVLNARDKFGPMMWAPIANNVVQLVVLSVYLGVWGTSDGRAPFSQPQMWLLGGGMTLGIAAQTLVMVHFLRKTGFRYKPRFDLRGTGLGHTFNLAKWTLGFVLVNQLVLVIVDKLATSATAGGSGAGLMVYNNAYLIFVLPHSLITVSLATAMLPSASRLAAEKDFAGVRDETLRTIKLSTSLLLPAAVIFIAMADPIAHILFGHGSGAQDARFVGWTLIAFAIGLVPFTIQYVCLRAFYALENTRITFFIQCLIAAVNGGLAVILVRSLDRAELVAPILALAYAISYVVGVVVSFRLLGRPLPGLTAKPVLRHLGRVLIAVLPGAVFAYYFSGWAVSRNDSKPVLFGSAAIAGLVALAAFIGLSKLLHLTEVNQIVGSLLRRRGGAGSADPQGGTDTSDPVDDDPPTRVLGTPGAGPDEQKTAEFPTAGSGSDPDDADEPTRVVPVATAGVAGAAAAGSAAAVTSSVGDDDSDEDTDDADAEGDPDAEDPGEDTEDWSLEDEEYDEDEDDSGEDTAEEVSPIRASSGQELGGRYRLEDCLVRRATTQTWRAFDEVLSRPVLMHLLPADHSRTEEVLATARRAAIATDSRFLRVLDASSVDEAIPFVVCEYAAGTTLQNLLATGPLSALEAAWLVHGVADALVSMHGQDLFHRRISPDTLVITATGNVKIVGFLLEAAISPEGSEAEEPGRHEQRDVHDLGRLLYCTLVSHWPGRQGYGMRAAPVDHDGNWLTPRQVRAGVSPALDRICDQILSDPPRQHEPPLRSAADIAAALGKVLGTADASHDLERRMRYPVEVVHVDEAEPPLTDADLLHSDDDDYADDEGDGEPTAAIATAALPAVDSRNDDTVATPAVPSQPVERGAHPARDLTGSVRPEPKRRWLGFLIGLVVVVMIASLITVALNLPKDEEPQTQAPAGPVVHQIAGATAFDPEGDGGNGEENSDEAALAHDGKPDTAWRTVSYRGNPALGGLKDGVGVVFDLGQPVKVSEITLELLGSGTGLEIRVPTNPQATEAPMGTAKDWRVVGRADKANQQATLNLSTPAQTRFVLVYLTSLPPESGNYRGGIAEASFKG